MELKPKSFLAYTFHQLLRQDTRQEVRRVAVIFLIKRVYPRTGVYEEWVTGMQLFSQGCLLEQSLLFIMLINNLEMGDILDLLEHLFPRKTYS